MFHWEYIPYPVFPSHGHCVFEDKFTARRKKIFLRATYGDFKKWYWGLADLFNPTKFNPTEWRTT